MNIDWQALLDTQIAVVCRSPEECEAFLREAAKQNIPMSPMWIDDLCDAAERQWSHSEDDPMKWYGVAYACNPSKYLGFCWPAWWANRGYQLVDFADAKAFSIPTIDDLI
nr:MAG TPA: hypothetical protein [Caudoviricetes sp.]